MPTMLREAEAWQPVALDQVTPPAGLVVVPTGVTSARALGAPTLSMPLGDYPTPSTVGLAGVGMTVDDLNDNGGSGWRGFDFYGSPDGAVWEGYDIWANGSLIDFPASDAGKTITFRKCRVYAGEGDDPWSYWCVLQDGSHARPTLIFEDCDLIGGADSAVSGGHYRLLRCRIGQSGDGLKAGPDVLVEDCYIETYIPDGGDPHSDGIQSLGTDSLTIRHNTIWMGEGATSCVILSSGPSTAISNVLIEDNLMAGGTYCVYGGYQTGLSEGWPVSNIRVLDNKISTVMHPNGGAFAPMTSVDPPAVTHTGNTWYDGPNAGMAID